jgi:hypothetical protein
MNECLGWALLQQGKLREAEQVTECRNAPVVSAANS